MLFSLLMMFALIRMALGICLDFLYVVLEFARCIRKSLNCISTVSITFRNWNGCFLEFGPDHID